jgi:NadR type nicotinamide-nucleotide adenylyltransferase
MITGFVWGKFMPLHRGHIYLIETALARVDRLTILLTSLQSQPIPGALRYQWLRELFPAAAVQHCADEIPQYPSETSGDYWGMWVAVIRRYLPVGPDLVFTSEAHGEQLAALLGARHVCVDLPRATFPISGTAVRADPLAYWDWLPPAVQQYYAGIVNVPGEN